MIKYHRGTLAEFKIWHDAVKELEGIPSTDGRTQAYSSAISHPNKQDDCIWDCGAYPVEDAAQYSPSEMRLEGFFQLL